MTALRRNACYQNPLILKAACVFRGKAQHAFIIAPFPGPYGLALRLVENISNLQNFFDIIELKLFIFRRKFV